MCRLCRCVSLTSLASSVVICVVLCSFTICFRKPETQRKEKNNIYINVRDKRDKRHPTTQTTQRNMKQHNDITQPITQTTNPQQRNNFLWVLFKGLCRSLVTYVTCVVFHCVDVLSFACMSLFVSLFRCVTCFSWVCCCLFYYMFATLQQRRE